MSKKKNLLISVEATEEPNKDVEVRYADQTDFDPIDDLEIFANEQEDVNDDEKVHFNRVLDAESFVPPTKRYPNPKLAKDKDNEEFLNSEEGLAKKEARAKRFGVEIPQEQRCDAKEINVDDETMKKLFDSFHINPENVRDKQLYRLNTLHVRGVVDMSTEDVFDYFDKFTPNFLEWINDISCNMVWEHKDDAVRAMLGMSRPIKRVNSTKSRRNFDDSPKTEDSPKKKRNFEDSPKRCDLDDNDDVVMRSDEENEQKTSEKVEEIGPNTMEENDEECIAVDMAKFAVPPGSWRAGNTCSKAELILLRFATINDVKTKSAERESTFYKKYGNPNYGGEVGLISSSRKRKLRGFDSRRSRNEAEFDDLRGKLKNAHRWEEIRTSGRRSSDDDGVSPYSDEEEQETKPKKRLKMQMRADDVEKKIKVRKKQLMAIKAQEYADNEPEDGEILSDEEPNIDGDWRSIEARKGGEDLRERLKKYRMKVTVENSPDREERRSSSGRVNIDSD